jgi:hypothetical protein
MKNVAAHPTMNHMTVEQIQHEVGYLCDKVTVLCVERFGPVAQGRIHGWFADGLQAHESGFSKEASLLLDSACVLSDATWRSLGGDTRDVLFELCGKRVESRGYLEKRLPHPTAWMIALGLSVCLGREETVALLSEVKREHIDEEVGRFWTPRIAAFQQFVRGEGDGSALRDATLEAYVASAGALDRFGQLLEAEFDLMAAIVAGQQAAYTAALVDALKKHKAWYGRGSEKNSAAARVALPTCMMVVRAKQRGLRREVESGYLPEYLVGAP